MLVNLDPANENVPYDCDINVFDLYSLTQAMEEHSLGPNGALLYCMELLEANFEWLKDQIEKFDLEKSYFVFDFPGQVELFTNHESVYNLLHRLEKELHFRLVAVHLADSSHCKDPLRFVSLSMLTLQSMLRLECAQINVMSKFDLFNKNIMYEEEDKDSTSDDIPLSYYADCQNLDLILDNVEKDSRFGSRLANLTSAVAGLIEDFGIVSFVPVAVEDKECMAFVMQEIDKANGYVFGGLTAGNESIFGTAMSSTNRDEYLESMERKYVMKR